MVEKQILQALTYDEEYARQVLPFLKEEYFTQIDQQIVYKTIREYFDKYNQLPAKEALLINLAQRNGVDEGTISNGNKLIQSFEQIPVDDWLLDQTESFCQDKAIYNSIMAGIEIIEKNPENKGQLPGLLQDALQVSFDNSVGHDFIDDAEERFKYRSCWNWCR